MRYNMNNYLVYKLTCQVTNKSYVGVTNDLRRRIRDHRNKNSSCEALKNAIALHGWESFTVELLHTNLQKEEAYGLEPSMIVEHNSRIPTGYNITAGGWNGRSGMTYVMSEDHKRKISEAHQGMLHTEETKQKLRDIKSTPEYKEKAHLARQTEEHQLKLQQGRLTEKYTSELERRKTPEYRELQHNRRKGIPHSKERCTSISAGRRKQLLDDIDGGVIRGVSFDKRSNLRPWLASMRLDGKKTYLGCFTTKEEAVAAVRARLVLLIECDQAS
jgi:group I intron endonuclease